MDVRQAAELAFEGTWAGIALASLSGELDDADGREGFVRAVDTGGKLLNCGVLSEEQVDDEVRRIQAEMDARCRGTNN